jgi:hypothetical protein
MAVDEGARELEAALEVTGWRAGQGRLVHGRESSAVRVSEVKEVNLRSRRGM